MGWQRQEDWLLRKVLGADAGWLGCPAAGVAALLRSGARGRRQREDPELSQLGDGSAVGGRAPCRPAGTCGASAANKMKMRMTNAAGDVARLMQPDSEQESRSEPSPSHTKSGPSTFSGRAADRGS